MMTRKDFIALADAMRPVNLSHMQVEAICDFLKSRNPRFNRYRWQAYLRGYLEPISDLLG